jgi:hypothetical protein
MTGAAATRAGARARGAREAAAAGTAAAGEVVEERAGLLATPLAAVTDGRMGRLLSEVPSWWWWWWCG